ncbi:MAG: glycosyltransferase family 4 protein [Rhodospirillales bacterium]|nr:glycosyltransferase family 4 protein [Rhodospirillales bacterium]
MLRDSILKKILRWGWSVALAFHAVLNVLFPFCASHIRVFYGGARPGDVGGPLVKVKRLRTLFPEQLWGFNVVYVLSNTPYLPDMAIALLKARGIPIVHNQNGVFYPGWYAGDWEAQNQRMARTFHKADYVFFQSEFCKHSAERYLGAREGAGEILYNAVDTEFYRPSETQAPRAGRAYRFLLTGKIDNHLFYRIASSLQGLAEAVRLGLDAVLVIAGRVAPDAQARTKALADELGIADRVRLTGPYTQEQAPTIYQGADAYVMTKHNDPCPNTVLEALSTGLPVLYSDTGGVGELVGDAGIGLICAQGWDEPQVPDAKAIAQGMLDIVAGHDMFSHTARVRAVERFDLRHWEQRHGEVFTRLIEERN